MHRLWLIFAQAATVAVAVLFVVSTFRPGGCPRVAPLCSKRRRRKRPARCRPRCARDRITKRCSAAHRRQHLHFEGIRSPRHPLLNDPLFRRFFGSQLPDDAAAQRFSLGSG